MKLAVRVLIFTRKTRALFYRKKGAPLFLRGLDEGATASIIEGIASSIEEPETSSNRDYTVIVLALSETLKTTLHKRIIVRGRAPVSSLFSCIV